MKRYAIWNKKDPILTPSGKVFTAEEWIALYPVAGLEQVAVVCGASEINGAFFGTLGQMVLNYQEQGCDFSNAFTDEEKLEAIEAFEDKRNAETTAASQNATINEELNAASLASIAASLEYQNMMTLDDVEEV